MLARELLLSDAMSFDWLFAFALMRDLSFSRQQHHDAFLCELLRDRLLVMTLHTRETLVPLPPQNQPPTFGGSWGIFSPPRIFGVFFSPQGQNNLPIPPGGLFGGEYFLGKS